VVVGGDVDRQRGPCPGGPGAAHAGDRGGVGVERGGRGGVHGLRDGEVAGGDLDRAGGAGGGVVGAGHVGGAVDGQVEATGVDARYQVLDHGQGALAFPTRRASGLVVVGGDVDRQRGPCPGGPGAAHAGDRGGVGVERGGRGGVHGLR